MDKKRSENLLCPNLSCNFGQFAIITFTSTSERPSVIFISNRKIFINTCFSPVKIYGFEALHLLTMSSLDVRPVASDVCPPETSAWRVTQWVTQAT